MCAWIQRATTDATLLKAQWGNNGALVGVPTGVISGFEVLDIDPRHGGDTWLEAKRHLLPVTRVHQTRSGGQHFFFRHHAGMRNSAGKIAPGVDVRAAGGYILWWPASGLPVLNEAPLAAWPEWLMKLAMPPQRSFTPPSVSTECNDAYIKAALHKASEAVACAPEGSRNTVLNRECWSLLRFVSDGKISPQDIANTLAAAALVAGLSRSEIFATLSSALRARGIA